MVRESEAIPSGHLHRPLIDLDFHVLRIYVPISLIPILSRAQELRALSRHLIEPSTNPRDDLDSPLDCIYRPIFPDAKDRYIFAADVSIFRIEKVLRFELRLPNFHVLLAVLHLLRGRIDTSPRPADESAFGDHAIRRRTGIELSR
jgi:hypothetical protein